jgi:ABC-type lipopolysaccharide export system ATPase subunit
MNEGKIIAEGTSNELIEDALVRKTYFGNMYSS